MSYNNDSQQTYTADHSDAVLRTHSERTAESSAKYLLDSGALKEDSRILDIGCGPASITCDFASLAPKGSVVGVETNEEVLEKARQLANSRGLTNIEFRTGDIHALNFPDNSFDIVHVHQVLQHIANPVQALREMLRVVKPGGVVASKTSDMATLVAYPDVDGLLDEWKELYIFVAKRLGGEPNAGRRVLSWAKEAGVKDAKLSATAWCIATPEGRAFWTSTWAERILTSFKDAALKAGVTNTNEFQKYVDAFRRWEMTEGGVLTLTHGELLCFK